MLEARLVSFPTLPTLPTKHSARSQAIGTASTSRFALLQAIVRMIRASMLGLYLTPHAASGIESLLWLDCRFAFCEVQSLLIFLAGR